MRSLLDINILIALLDPKHIFHSDAHTWWSMRGDLQWASCPLTENGFLRIMSNPRYDKHKQFSFTELAKLLGDFARDTQHEFWPDDISLLDDSIIPSNIILGSKLITDTYLLALAVKNNGRLVTFDAKISRSTVIGATAKNLSVISVA